MQCAVQSSNSSQCSPPPANERSVLVIRPWSPKKIPIKEAKKLRVEKIKTIGDCYMAAVGLPEQNPMHAKAMAKFGLRLVECTKQGGDGRGKRFVHPATGLPVRIRVGLHSGSCVAGVIGKRKFAFDVWGDAVNTASRMESNCADNKVLCTAATFFECEPPRTAATSSANHTAGTPPLNYSFLIRHPPVA